MASLTGNFGPHERWSRNCGSGGIGYSGQITTYKDGVLEANWVEEKAGVDLRATGGSVLNGMGGGAGGEFTANSTQRISYNPYGKVGEDLLMVSQRHDNDLSKYGLKGDILLRHGDFTQAPVQCNATLNQLTYGEKHLGEPRVQSYLWAGSKHNDRTVPLSTQTLNLTATKKAEWHEQETASPYATSTRSAAMSAALVAADTPPKRGTIKPQADNGQPSTVGRKPLGEFVDECDKNYRVTGMRHKLYSDKTWMGDTSYGFAGNKTK